MSNLILSLITSLFWSSVLVLILIIVRKKNLLKSKWGTTYIVGLCIACMVRLLFPYDFGLQRRINCPGVFSRIYEFFVLDTYTVQGWEFCISDILIILWLSVSILLLSHSVFSYVLSIRKIRKKSRITDRYDEILCKIQGKTGKRKRQSRICRTGEIHIPMNVGILHPVILLPEQEYTEEEMYFILYHEYSHICYYDTLLKWMGQIVCCIFWWNPFAYLLQKELSEALENRCDLNVVQDMETAEVTVYLRTILRSLNDAIEGERTMAGLALNGNVDVNQKERALKERFRLVAEYDSNGKTGKAVRGLCCAVLVVLVMASYSMVWVPRYDPPAEDFEGAYVPSVVTDYIELDKDGAYYFVTELGRDPVSTETVMILRESGVELR